MHSSELELEKAKETRSGFPLRTLLLLTGFSVFYFADVCLRASEKYFWFDELGTVYQCRLSLHGLWHALRAGFDFNPPLLYLLTKIANDLFGEGLIVTRLPEIIGFWIFCLCLFRFVSKRAGPIAGFAAMAIPVFTGAFYYAYDARPHGLVLAFCGLALVCWQESLERRRERIWLAGFSIALFAAFMTHCYAITLAAPFAVAELVKSLGARRIESRRWIALATPVLLAGVIYVPLLRAYHATVGDTGFLNFSPLRWTQIGTFYNFLLAPCILIVLLVLLLLTLNATDGIRYTREAKRQTANSVFLEIVLAVSFLALPVFGLLLALKMHSPFYDRYFMSALAGFCILVGFGIGTGKRAHWMSTVLAGVMACCLVSSVLVVLWHRSQGWPEHLAEPSSGFSSNVSLSGPLVNYPMLLSAAKKGERIVVLWPMDFFYLVNYAPELRGQLYYINWDDHDTFYRVLERIHQYAPVPYHTVSAGEFYASRDDFMFFGLASDSGQLRAIAGDTILKSLEFSNGRFLADIRLKPPKHE